MWFSTSLFQPSCVRISLDFNTWSLLNSSRLCPQYIVPETTTNWPLIGGLGGAGAVVAVIIIIVIICVCRKRRKKQQLEFAAREQEIEMKDRGKAVAGEFFLECYNTSQCGWRFFFFFFFAPLIPKISAKLCFSDSNIPPLCTKRASE